MLQVETLRMMIMKIVIVMVMIVVTVITMMMNMIMKLLLKRTERTNAQERRRMHPARGGSVRRSKSKMPTHTRS